mgnify:CR=1 FL=1
MNRGSLNFLTFYILLGFLLVLSPSSNLYAQDEDDSVEEIFWGDEEEESFDEEFDFSDDEEFEDDMEGLEFDDEEFSEDEFDDEFIDDEDMEDFSEDFAEEPEEDIGEAASRLGYTLNIVGASPGFVNHGLSTYNSGVDFRASFEFPMLLQIAGVRFRLGAEVGTFKFTNGKPIGGVYSGVHATGILSFPAGPGQVKIGGGIVGKGLGFIAENSYGFALGDALDIRLGIRSTTALNVKNDKDNILGTVSWLDGLIILGVSL